MRTAPTSIACCALLTAASSCVDPVDPPSSYDTTVYLCDDAVAFSAEVERCRVRHDEDDACAGVVSLRGQLDEEPFVVTGLSTDSTFQDVVRLDTTIDVGGALLAGRGAYFEYELTVGSLGVDKVGAVLPRTFDVLSARRDFSDAIADVSFRATTAAQSADTALTSGSLVVTFAADDELAGRLDVSAFSGRTRVEGCFHTFATAVQLTSEVP